MNNHPTGQAAQQADLHGREATRSLPDELLTRSRLYTQSRDFKKLLDFVARLRNFAPFNAMLLQIQKPGLSFAATANDWWARFERSPKEGARPLLILWPVALVALVYDVLDTEGKPLPEDVACFFAHGSVVQEHSTVDAIDLYQVMHAAGQVETHLGLNAQTSTPLRNRPKPEDGFAGRTLFSTLEE